MSARVRKSLDENEKGFTLVELLVVVIIIGILAAIAIPVYLGQASAAKDSAAKSDLANARTALVVRLAEGPTPAAVSASTPVSTVITNFQMSGTTDQVNITKLSPTAGTFCLNAKTEDGKTWFTSNIGKIAESAPSGC